MSLLPDQPSLWDQPPPEPAPVKRSPHHVAETRWVERFAAFHQANPTVYGELVTRARRLREAGHRHYSIKGLFEAIRFDRAVAVRASTDGLDAGIKLNNSFTALYARLIMANEPDLADFFETRELRAEG